jgi:hypothetical protein
MGRPDAYIALTMQRHEQRLCLWHAISGDSSSQQNWIAAISNFDLSHKRLYSIDDFIDTHNDVFIMRLNNEFTCRIAPSHYLQPFRFEHQVASLNADHASAHRE